MAHHLLVRQHWRLEKASIAITCGAGGIFGLHEILHPVEVEDKKNAPWGSGEQIEALIINSLSRGGPISSLFRPDFHG